MDWSKFLPVRTAVLTLGGLVCFVVMAALIYPPAAWGVAGMGAWLVEFLTSPSPSPEERTRR